MTHKLIDSSVYIALINNRDIQHEKAKSLFASLDTGEIILPDYIYTEVLTVLKRKTFLFGCKKFMGLLKYLSLEINIITKEEIELSNEYFFRENKLSFQDCLLIATSKLKKTQLFTFDKALQIAWDKVK